MKEPTLSSAFGLEKSALVSFVGGGGKTSLIFALAGQLPGNVVITTTTRIFAAQMKLAPAVCDSSALDELGAKLAQFGSCLVVGTVQGDKAHGVDISLPGELLERDDVDFVLVEADGSRMRPIKAPAQHEPVIPPQTTLLVPVVGIDACGRPAREVAHRPELVLKLLANFSPPVGVDDLLEPAAIAALVTHPQGGLKGAPEQAAAIPYINKVESEHQLSMAHQIARLILRQRRVAHVVIGAVGSGLPVKAKHTRVTAVVLAAGQSKRMGQTKQLLPWGNGTVLGQTLKNLRQSAVDDILVVTGHDAAAAEAIARGEGAQVTFNAGYGSGEMLSSLKAALRILPEDRPAILVMLADQPMVEPETVDRLLEAYWQGKGDLIAPVFEERRGNPVLIGARYFGELLALPAGAAPRDLLRRHEAELRLVAVDSDSILRDLDLPEDYERWRP